jgi:hypothetical protein
MGIQSAVVGILCRNDPCLIEKYGAMIINQGSITTMALTFVSTVDGFTSQPQHGKAHASGI